MNKSLLYFLIITSFLCIPLWADFETDGESIENSAGNIQFDPNDDGVSEVIIDNNFNLGISTLEPSSKLYVAGNMVVSTNLVLADNIQLTSTLLLGDGSSASPSMAFTNDGDSGYFLNGTGNIAFVTGGSAKGELDASGNLGIGTTNPLHHFHFVSSVGNAIIYSAATGDLSIAGAGTSSERFGRDAHANDTDTLAFGFNAIANESGSTVIGVNAWSNETDTVLIGDSNRAEATVSQDTIYIGPDIRTSVGFNSLYTSVLGSRPTISGTGADNSVIGGNATLSNSNQVLVGSQVSTVSNVNTAVGALASTLNNLTTVVGARAKANQTALAVGADASTTQSGTTLFGAGTDAGATDIALGAFAAGSASSVGARSNGITRGYSIGAFNTGSDLCVSIGAYANNPGGSYTLNIGAGADASSSYMVAIGADTSITSTFATALGRGATTTANYQFVCGSDESHFSEIFFGRGAISTTPEAVRIQNSARTGTNVAGYNLEIASGRGTGTGSSGNIRFQTAPAGSSGTSLNAHVDRMVIDGEGNVGIGAEPSAAMLTVGGNVAPSANVTYDSGSTSLAWKEAVTSNLTIVSDRRYKSDIVDIEVGRDALMKLRPVQFAWKHDPSSVKMGFLAQEVAEHLPLGVNPISSAAETMSLRYSDIMMVVLSGIQEMRGELDLMQGKGGGVDAEMQGLLDELDAALKEVGNAPK